VALGLKNMKYVIFHWDLFDHPTIAFTIALQQIVATVFVEIVNIVNLNSLSDIISIVQDFIALGVISDFDEIFLRVYD